MSTTYKTNPLWGMETRYKTLATSSFHTGGEVLAADVGLTGNGSDDTADFQSALDIATTANKKLILDSSKTYLLTSLVDITGKNSFELDFNGAKVLMKSGTPVGSGRGMFRFTSCINYALRRAHIDANRANRTYSDIYYAYNLIINGGYNIVLDNPTCNNAVADNLYIQNPTPADLSTSPHDIVVLNFNGDNGSRQSVSIISGSYIYFAGGSLTNTNGYAPQAGVDFEPNTGNDADGSLHDVILDSMRISGCVGYAAAITAKCQTRNIELRNCDLSDCDAGAISNFAQGTRIIKNNIHDFTNPARGVLDFGSSGGFGAGALVEGCTIYGINAPSGQVFYLHSDAGVDLNIRQNTITSPIASTVAILNASSKFEDNVVTSPSRDCLYTAKTGVSIKGNMLSGVPRYTLYEDPAGGSNIITGNTLTNCKNSLVGVQWGALRFFGTGSSCYGNTMTLSPADTDAVAIKVDGSLAVSTPNTIVGYKP